jgi:hypothetical protein
MKEINQLIHLTPDISRLESILKNGLYTSYNKEVFADKNVLIPMISFCNVLFRDLGENEVIDYGNYGIVIDRTYGIEDLELNPVLYLKANSIVENTFKYNFESTLVPQTVEIIKKISENCKCENVTDLIHIEPLNQEVKELINSIDKNTSDKLIFSLRNLFTIINKNTLKQILLSKPYKVKTKKGEEKIAYNEREWRKSYFNLDFVLEYEPDGNVNEKYTELIEKNKPHFKDDSYTLKIPLNKIKYIIVKNIDDIDKITNFISTNKIGKIDKEKIRTLNQLKEFEHKQ